MTDNQIILTGGTGFIGSYVLPKLLSKYPEHEIVATYNHSNPKKMDRVKWVHCDLLVPNDVSELLCEIPRADRLYHMAWDVKPGYKDSYMNISWLNASYDLIKRFQADKSNVMVDIAGTCFDAVQTCGAYPSISTLYGGCKTALFMMLQSMPTVITRWHRIYYVYGPGEHKSRLIPTLINALMDNQHITLTSSIVETLPYVYVDAVAQSIVDCNNDQVYNDNSIVINDIYPTQPIMMRDLILQIADLLDADSSNIVGGTEVTESLLSPKFRLIEKYSMTRGLIKTINYWKEQRK